MPKFQDVLNNDLAKGAALGVGAVVVAAAALPAIITVSRPLARAAIKSGLLFLEKGRELMAEAGEGLEDMVAEVKSELAEARSGVAAGAADAKEDFAAAAGEESSDG
ncbi:MAG: hypothetical protein H6R26_1321 [Proteobacteria bacterium]|nr:hypothetical protein [Pseudomonadota bacterium]